VTDDALDTYDFQLPGDGDTMVRVDAVGVALISTVLMNRDRTPSGEDNGNRYQDATPDVQNIPSTLLGFVHFLRALHSYWHDDLDRQGFEPCSKKVLGKIIAKIPVNRLGKAEEIARGVAFLVDENAGFVTGSTLSINGGQHMY
jgi:NAD(P)-dependent dehydrogenase (short-subunit alcohol dehydrogenase family)